MTLDANGFYAGLRDGVALNMLKQYGFQANILVKSGEVYDPIQGLVTTPASWVAFPTYAVYGGGGAGKSAGVNTSTEGKTLNRLVKKEVYLDASVLTIQPSTDDLFEDENGNTFEILSVDNTNPGGVTVLWRMTVKR